MWRLSSVDGSVINEHGSVYGMRNSKGNRSTRRTPAVVPLCTPQIPQDLSWVQSQDVAAGILSYETALSGGSLKGI
jgi:hypothetical protein